MARDKTKTRPSRRKRLLAALCCVLAFVLATLGVLQIGVWYSVSSWAYWRPNYAKINLEPILQKETLEDSDYEILYRQTGLTKLGVDGLLAENKTARIYALQEAFFADYPVVYSRFNPFTYMDVYETGVHIPMAALQDGDIIVTAATRVSWWRYGHAALVVDGKNERILESIGPGSKSEIGGANCFSEYSSFLILRPKVDAALKKQAVDFAKTTLLDLPYRFSVGILSEKDPKTLRSTQCAHLVWYAYKRFGIDLDSNGGGVVKPQDIANSPYVEVVQAYGYDLDELWS